MKNVKKKCERFQRSYKEMNKLFFLFLPPPPSPPTVKRSLPPRGGGVGGLGGGGIEPKIRSFLRQKFFLLCYNFFLKNWTLGDSATPAFREPLGAIVRDANRNGEISNQKQLPDAKGGGGAAKHL
jgi:hypothetical protein